MDYFIIFCAKYLVYISVGVAGIYFLTAPFVTKKLLVLYGGGVGLAILLSDLIAGKIFYNARPFVSEKIVPLISHVADNGFPSDHTILAAAVAVIVMAFNKKLGFVLFIMAIFVGYGRVAGGVHHLIDVVASILIATVWGVIGYFVKRYIQKKQSLQKGAETL